MENHERGHNLNNGNTLTTITQKPTLYDLSTMEILYVHDLPDVTFYSNNKSFDRRRKRLRRDETFPPNARSPTCRFLVPYTISLVFQHKQHLMCQVRLICIKKEGLSLKNNS